VLLWYKLVYTRRTRAGYRGRIGTALLPAASGVVVLVAARERGTEVRGRAQISLRARVHGSRENREPPARQKRLRAERGTRGTRGSNDKSRSLLNSALIIRRD